MTARHNIRIGNRRLGRDRVAIDATPAPRVGEMLQLARERKGVDLFRAERDTKIRLKYLAALEDSEYAALPPLVYTKGFLRNYAIYLGLDPEEILTRWRDETQVGRKHQERPSVAPPPQPLASPRRGVAITPGLFVAAIFSLVVVGVFVWIGWQLIRFADVPTLAITNPAALVSTVDRETTVLSGVSGPGAEITITTPDGRRMTFKADDNGNWSREVELTKGRNDFTIVATDAVTHRPSAPVNLIINVPLPGSSPSVTSAPTPAPIRLTLGAPIEGVTVSDGQITVSGTTSGTRVTIETAYLGPASSQATPGASGSPSAPPATPTSTPSLEPGAPSTSPGPTPPAMRDVTVDGSGVFSQTLAVPPGRWQITVTASATGVAPLSQTRTVSVQPAVIAGLTVVISAVRDKSWVHVTADGLVVKAGTWGGPTLDKGESATFTAVNEIAVDLGRPLAIDITVNGVAYQLSETAPHWVIRPGQAPQPTSAP